MNNNMKNVKKITILISTILLAYYCAFSFDDSASANTKNLDNTNNDECSNNSANKCARIYFRSSSTILKKGNPFLITIEIENISDKPYPLDYFPQMFLQEKEISNNKNVKRNIYKSIVYLESSSEFVRKMILVKGEKIEFQVDITDLSWAEDDFSYFPSANLFSLVPPGEYELHSEMLSGKIENYSGIEGVIRATPIDISLSK